MALQINRTLAAKNDLVEIWRYIASDNENAATSVLKYIDHCCQNLGNLPQSGHQRDDLAPRLRCLPVGKSGWRSQYLVFYRKADNSVEIIRILEGHRNITPELFQKT